MVSLLVSRGQEDGANTRTAECIRYLDPSRAMALHRVGMGMPRSTHSGLRPSHAIGSSSYLIRSPLTLVCEYPGSF